MKRLFLLTLLCIIAISGFGQLAYQSSFLQDAGNPGGLNTGTDSDLNSWTEILPASLSTNQWSSTQSIPFDFDFFGSPVTHFRVSANGLVTFDTTSTLLPNASENLPSPNLPDRTIATFWTAFTTSGPTGSNDRVYTRVFGTAPNRQLYIRWHSFEMNTASFVYLSCVLEECSNTIYIVDQYSTTAAGATTTFNATVGIQRDNTTALQFGTNNVNLAGNGSGNADNDYFAFVPSFPNDAGISDLVLPVSPITAGLQQVRVSLQNFGSSSLNSTTIGWSINGTPQTNIVSNPNLSPGSSVDVDLGSFNFPMGFTEIKAWTTNPNGVEDSVACNDTLQVSVCTSFAGNYTVGGVSADFPDLTSAISGLTTCGIGGPVTLDIAPGVYNEQLTIGEIPGVNAVNTLTFQGGDTSLVKITSSSAVDIPTILIDGGDYLTFRNLTIENTGTTDDTWGVVLRNVANYNTFDSCQFLMPITTTGDVAAIISSNSLSSDASSGNNANHLTVDHSTFIGGERGVSLYGSTALASRNDGHRILNSTFLEQDEDGIYLEYQDSVLVSGNFIEGKASSTFYAGIDLSDVQIVEVTANIIQSPDEGIEFDDINFDITPGQPSLLANNLINAPNDDGLNLDDVEQLNIYHNTSVGSIGMLINDMVNVDIRNNIFVGVIDVAVDYTDNATDADTIDFNIYHTINGANLIEEGSSSTNYATLADWQNNFTQGDANSLSGDPGFTSSTDLHLVGTLALDAGDPGLGIGVDVDGDPRPLPPTTGFDIGADEYTVNLNCLPPSGLTLTQPTFDGAIFSWVAGGSETSWNIQYGFAGFALGTGTQIDGITNNPYTLTGLISVTPYDVYIQAACTGGDTSIWVGPLSFTTLSCAGLSGSYTIGGAGADYADFGSAAADLTDCGLAGPVTFNVAPGTYNEQLTLGELFGSNAAHTVTFDGGDTASVILTYATANDTPTVLMEGADYVTFRNMTLENTEVVGDVWAVILRNGSDYNTFDQVRVRVPVTTTTDVMGIVTSNSLSFDGSSGNNANYLTISNSTFIGGERGVSLYGSSASADYNIGHQILNCTFIDQDEDGIYIQYQDSITVSGNVINPVSSTTFYSGIDVFGVRNLTLTGNTVNSTDWGMELDDINLNFTPTVPSLFANNMVNAGGTYGLNVDDVENLNVYHNTIVGDIGMLIDDMVEVDIRNNIFVGSTDVAVDYEDAATDADSIDHNIYHTVAGSSLIEETALDINYVTFASWQANFPTGDANSLTGDPGFANVNDLHIIGSLPFDAGDSTLGITVDIDGDVRPFPLSNGFDIGADEYFFNQNCPNPSALAADSIGASGVLLSWNPGGTEPEWYIQYGPSGFALGSGTIDTVTTNPYLLTGLAADQTFDIYIQAACTGGDTSIFVGPLTVTTFCSAITSIPYFEGFENGGQIPDCWSEEFVNFNTNWRFQDENQNNSVNSFDGSFMAVFFESSFDAHATRLVSPAFDLSAQPGVNLSFWHTQAVWFNDQDTLRVLYRTSSTSPWEVLATYTEDISDWEQETIALPNISGDYYIAFEASSGYGRGVTIDNVELFVPTPNDVGVAAVNQIDDCGGDDFVQVTITNLGSASQSNVQAVYSINGPPAVDTVTFTGTLDPGASVDLTFSNPFGPTAQGTYLVEAWTILPTDTTTSNDTASASFRRTDYPIPFLQDFETTLGVPQDWQADGTVQTAHNSPSVVLFDNLFSGDTTFEVITPNVGPVNTGDEFRFFYRYVDFAAGTDSTILDPGDTLFVQLSDDCGNSYFDLDTITQSNHIASTALALKRYDLASYVGQLVRVRLFAKWGDGDYFLDFDDIYFGPLIGGSVVVSSTYNGADISCNGVADGEATATGTNGIAPYTYQWDAAAGNQATATATGLAAGTYSVTITDATGNSLVDSVTLTEPTLVTASQTVSDYNGFNIRCAGETNGSIDLTVNGGTAPYSYDWSNGDTTQDLTDVGADIYTVDVSDANGCTLSTITQTLTEPTPLTLDNATIVEPLCTGDVTGSIALSVSGGIGTYTYAWSDTTFGDNASIMNLAAGTYSVMVTDSNGCTLDTLFEIVEPLPIEATTATAEDSAFVTGTGGTAPYSFLWDAAAGSATTDTVTGLADGSYQVIVTDANGCTDTAFVDVLTTIDGITDLEDIRLIPNPTDGRFTLDITMTQAAEIGVRIFDARGRQVMALENQYDRQVAYRVDLTDFAQGIYQVQIHINGQVVVKRVMVQ
ncbi:MAG: right-handed parallel beta-helix repeat-containing protein [Bacteroidota bacterium]